MGQVLISVVRRVGTVVEEGSAAGGGADSAGVQGNN